MNVFLIMSIVALSVLIIILTLVMVFRKKIVIKKLQYEAERGVSSAQLALAGYYFSLEPKDVQQGVVWLRKAADGGSSEAQTALATIYGDGRLLPQNKEESIKWFLQGAMGGNIIAQKTMAGIYHFSVGLDKKTAYAWYRAAATKGDNHAVEMAEKLMGEFSEKEKSEAKDIAAEYIKLYAGNKEKKKGSA